MSLKIAIIGSRGIPAKYGGFETFAEELSTRLAAKGYEVFVSCEGGSSQKIYTYRGVKLFYFPIKPFFRVIYETIYDIYSLIKSSLMCDCIYVLGYGAGFFFFIPKIFRKKLIVNVDGMEWTRDKYNKLEKAILYCSEISAVRFSDVIIADAFEIKKHIESAHGKKAVFIPYGVDVPEKNFWDSSKLNNIIIGNDKITKLQSNDYYLIVARLEPENNIHLIIEGFLMANPDKKLVVIGNFMSPKYKQGVDSILKKFDAFEKVIFTGAIYEKYTLNMLRNNCFVYFHGHSVGGTNPSLLEIMAMKRIIVAHDNKFNREVGDKNILYFKCPNNIKNIIELMEINVENYCKLKEGVQNRVTKRYSWNKVVDDYNQLLLNMFNCR